MFAFLVALELLLLFVPGYLLLRGLGFERVLSLASSPAVTIAEVGVAGVVFAKIGVTCTWLTVLLPCIAVGLLALAIRFAFLKGVPDSFKMALDGFSVFGLSGASSSWLCLGVTVAVSVVLGAIYFVGNLGAPDAMFQAYDNMFHSASVRNFVESGNWSSFEVCYFVGDQALIDPIPASGFYPAAWHALAAQLISCTGISVALAENVTNFAVSFVVFPASVFFFARVVFAKAPYAVFFCSVCAVAFAAFPWGFLTFGPLYPNLASYSIVLDFAALFVLLFRPGIGASARTSGAFAWLTSLVALVLSQPNAVFVAAVLLAPFCVVQASRIPEKFGWGVSDRARLALRIACGIACAAGIAAIWMVIYYSPFVSGPISQFYPAYYTKLEAIANALLLSFRLSLPQVVLAAFVIVGGVYTLLNRRYLWLSFAYGIALVMYTINASTETFFLKSILVGFWYSDVFRVAAMAGILGIPLACLGLNAALLGALRLFGRDESGKHDQPCVKRSGIAAVCIAAAFTALNFAPNIGAGDNKVETPFGYVGETVAVDYSAEAPNVLSPEERAFVQRAREMVGDGELLVNIPDDGSAFSYGLDGSNVYYRVTRTYGGENETPESRAIRERLCDVATDVEVQDALKSIDAEYLLVLDQGKDDLRGERLFLFTWDFYSEIWDGVSSINDSTPGFEVVLSDGDMRLYRIVA